MLRMPGREMQLYKMSRTRIGKCLRKPDCNGVIPLVPFDKNWKKINLLYYCRLISLMSSPQAPLAERLRPQTLDQLVGQQHLTGKGSVLRTAIEKGKPPSMILWGPP